MVSSLIGAVVLLCCAAETGPRLSDADFFAGLDLKRPGMEAVAKAVEQSDWPAARTAFGQYFKTHAAGAGPSNRAGGGRRGPAYRYGHRRRTAAAPVAVGKGRGAVGRIFDLGPQIDWSSNQMTEGESATVEWNASLNRHFYFAELTQAYRLTGEDKYAAEVVAQMLELDHPVSGASGPLGQFALPLCLGDAEHGLPGGRHVAQRPVRHPRLAGL